MVKVSSDVKHVAWIFFCSDKSGWQRLSSDVKQVKIRKEEKVSSDLKHVALIESFFALIKPVGKG